MNVSGLDIPPPARIPPQADPSGSRVCEIRLQGKTGSLLAVRSLLMSMSVRLLEPDPYEPGSQLKLTHPATEFVISVCKVTYDSETGSL